ncbi:MAG: repeat-containing protein YrrB [Cyanobacteriota bacterium]|jgi:tetratricopeptide (TPR) repeat protein
MNLECVRDFIHLLRSPYSPDFEFEKKDFRQVLWDRKSALFKNFFEPQESGLTFLDLIQFLSASFGENDRYLEINSSGDWTNFLAGILQDHPIASCIIQTSFDHELSFEDERILNLPELYLDNISFFQVDQDSDVRDILEILKTEEPEIENTIVLLPIVEDYRQHFLNLLTIAPFLGTSALLLTPGANYPWIRQGNQDFIHFHPQARTLLDLALKNRHLGDRLAGVQVIGIGEDWVEFYDSHIHFNPHFLAGLTAIPSGDRSASLALTTYGLHQQTVQQHLGEAISEHQQGDRDRAADLYQKILQQDLHQDLAWANLSTIAFERDDRDQALQFSYIAAQICPENDLHWRNLGLLYKRNRDLQQSIYLFRKALQINNQFPLNYLNLAKALEQANQFAEAAQILQAGREQFPLDFLLYVKQRLVKPLIYKSSDHVEQIHGEILDHLKQIFHDIQAEPDCLLKLNLNQINEIFEALDLAYFAYQGLDLVPMRLYIILCKRQTKPILQGDCLCLAAA